MPNMVEYHFNGSLKDSPRRKIQQLLSGLGPRKLCRLVVTMLLFLAVPITFIALQQKQEIRQHANEPKTTSDTPLGRIYENDGKMWMENSVFKVGFTLAWGGTISDVVLNGTNIINTNNTPGRGIQVAVFDGDQKYDSCSGCTGVFGWNPTQGGDMYNHGSPVEIKSITPNTFYIKAKALEWFPDKFGGNKNTPITSDTIIEQTSSFVPNYPNVLKIHYKISHLGQDSHANNGQQVPVLTLTKEMNTLAYYAGKNPWQNEPLTQVTLTTNPNQILSKNYYASEQWTSVSDGKNTIGVYIPGQLSYFRSETFSGDGGPAGVGATVISPLVFFAFTPGRILENDAYIIFDTPSEIRKTVAALKQETGTSHAFDSVYSIDTPQPYSTLSGSTKINGWAYDSVPIRKIEVLVDGNVAGEATLGIQRLDVLSQWPNFSGNSGYRFFLDTTKYGDGTHRVALRITTSDNKVVDSSSRVIVLANKPEASLPVFRLYKQTTGDHLYTTGKAEADSAVNLGYQLDGIGFYAYTSLGPNLVPVYRLINPQKTQHLLTSTASEVDAVTKQGYTNEGVAFYAYSQANSDTLPVYRLLKTVNYGHFYTTSIQEKDNAIQNGGYTLEGIGFYVPNKQ